MFALVDTANRPIENVVTGEPRTYTTEAQARAALRKLRRAFPGCSYRVRPLDPFVETVLALIASGMDTASAHREATKRHGRRR